MRPTVETAFQGSVELWKLTGDFGHAMAMVTSPPSAVDALHPRSAGAPAMAGARRFQVEAREFSVTSSAMNMVGTR
jgi:hypothetical protein